MKASYLIWFKTTDYGGRSCPVFLCSAAPLRYLLEGHSFFARLGVCVLRGAVGNVFRPFVSGLRCRDCSAEQERNYHSVRIEETQLSDHHIQPDALKSNHRTISRRDVPLSH